MASAYSNYTGPGSQSEMYRGAQQAALQSQNAAPGIGSILAGRVHAAAQAVQQQAPDAAAAKQAALTINSAPINATAAPGGAAAANALAQVSDPNRFAAANQARDVQNGVVGYANGVMSGQSPLVSALQRQQGEAQGQNALVASGLSNQNGMAPGLTQRNVQAAQATLHGNLAAQGQANDIMAQRSVLDAAGQAATGMRGQDQAQVLGSGAQQLQGAGTYAATGQNAANRDLAAQGADQSAYLGARGQDLQAQQAAAALAQGQQQWQQTNDANNSWWNKYALPGLSLGASVGAGAIAGAGKGGGDSSQGQGGGYVDPYAVANGGMYTHG